MSTITKEWLQQKIADMEATRDEIPFGLDEDDSNTLAALRIALASLEEGTELKRKSSIHDALCEKYSVESLADFVDWQRNHITELEAAPPAPVGKGETAVMPDYPGYVMTQRECYQAGKKAGLDEAGNSPVIANGWVACSERMPEDEQEVITHNIFGYRHVSFLDEHSGHFFDRLDGSPVDCVEHVLVSHWMPLPAAPQQEVKP